MAKPLLNDFGVEICREKARAALEAAGWRREKRLGWLPLISRKQGWDITRPHTLREAWAAHLAQGGAS